MIRCTVRFYEELNYFLDVSLRKTDIDSASITTRSVKDLIESFGVPHVEVDLVLVNGQSVGFDHLIRDGDRVSVYPVFERFDLANVTRLRPEPLRVPRFIADVHLKTLARRLRMLGFDTIYDPTLSDPNLAERSSREERILLSRDRQLFMRKSVTRGLYVRNTDPVLQAREVVDRLDLYRLIEPFRRCILCNAPITSIETATAFAAGDQVPQSVRTWCDEYYRCDGCGKIYWKGSHYQRMLGLVEEICGDPPQEHSRH